MSRMIFSDRFRTAFDNIDALRSVHHNLAKLKAAREVARQASGLPSLKSKAWLLLAVNDRREPEEGPRRGGDRNCHKYEGTT